MSASDILRMRLANQHLSRQTFDDPAQLVVHLGAVQSQDYPGAKWALGQRLRKATEASIEQAFAEGKILRTHIMRPTWHFVAPADIRWLQALTASRVKKATATYARVVGVDEALVGRANEAIARALAGGRHLTRTQIGDALKSAGVKITNSQALGHVLGHAELDAVICSGPPRGKQQTYALLDERVAPARPLDREEALGELARRYFTSHGPATLRDFAWWSGLTVSDGKRAVALNGSTFAQCTLDGEQYWYAADADISHGDRAAYLLPSYDEYTVAYTNRARALIYDPISTPLPSVRETVALSSVVVIGGRIVGLWRRDPRGAVTTRWSREPSDGVRGLYERAVDRYTAFVRHSVTS